MGNQFKVGDILESHGQENGEEWSCIWRVRDADLDCYKLTVLEVTLESHSQWVGETIEHGIDVVHDHCSLLKTSEVKIEKRFCDCQMLTLMRTGCACGGK